MIPYKRCKQNYPYYEVEKIENARELMEKAVSEAGDKPAFKYKEGKEVRTVSYREFRDDTFALGTALAELGMIDRHVALISENSYKWVTVYITMLQSNGVYVPVDKELPLKDIINVLENSDSELLFYSGRYEKYIPELMEALPRIKYFVALSDKEPRDASQKKIKYKDLLERGRELYKGGDTSYSSIQTDTSKMRVLVYTSGTTGMAKGVMLSEKNLISVAYYGMQVSRVYTTALSVLPLHHTYEGAAGLLFSLHSHACVCINESLKSILKNMQLYKPDYIYLVPAFVEMFYKRIWAAAEANGEAEKLRRTIALSDFLRRFRIDLREPLFRKVREVFGGRLIKIPVGGAPLRAELGDFFDSIGINLVNGYGITECSPLVSANRDDFNDAATVGVKIPCVEIKFEDVNEDGEGEICVRGDTVMLGYYKNPELTAEVISADGWFRTGDYGHMNEKEQLVITGRKKNLIVLDNGKNVFPEEIENYIMGIPYVAEVVVRGLRADGSASGLGGGNGVETGLLAEVYLNPEKLSTSYAELSEEELVGVVTDDIYKVCRELPIYKQITRVVLRDKPFDKTTTNKIKR